MINEEYIIGTDFGIDKSLGLENYSWRKSTTVEEKGGKNSNFPYLGESIESLDLIVPYFLDQFPQRPRYFPLTLPV